jgi:hypothetical protein
MASLNQMTDDFVKNAEFRFMSKKEKISHKIKELDLLVNNKIKERDSFNSSVTRTRWSSDGMSGWSLSKEATLKLEGYKYEIDVLNQAIRELHVEYYKCFD